MQATLAERLMHGGAAEAGRSVARGELSTEELVSAALARIERENPRLGAVVELRAQAVVERLERNGVEALPGWPDGVDPGRDFDAFGRHLAGFFAATAPGGDIGELAALREAPDRAQAHEAWARYFESIDVFLCPIAPTAAPEHDDRPFTERTIATTNGPLPYSRVPFWISHATLSGLPAATVPVGTTASTGLPVAIQVIGAQHEDNTVLAFAEGLRAIVRPA